MPEHPVLERPLDGVGSLKLKLGLLVAISVLLTGVLVAGGSVAGAAGWVTIPVAVGVSLGVTQVLARGMTAPVREMTAVAQRMSAGDWSGRVSATADDEVGRLGRAFNAMAADLERTDAERRELVATVSHELRTPLTALCAMLDNVADGVVAPDSATLAAASDQAARLGALVTDLLDLSRVDAGIAPLRLSETDVAALVNLAVAEHRVGGRGVELRTAVEAGLVVSADPARLRQLVANLLDNAARHGPAGGTVTVAARGAGKRWLLEVRDEGPGVAAADRDRVFERFGQGPAATGAGAATGGTGLGLAIARWVADLHGGGIGFVEVPTGAVVQVDLPRRPAERPGSPGPSTTGTTPSTRPQETPVPSTAPATTPPVSSPMNRTGTQPAARAPYRPLTEQLFGRWWPERDLGGRPLVVLAAVLVGVLAGVALPFRSTGLGLTLVLAAGGLTAYVGARRRHEPFTRGCAVLAGLLCLVPVLRDASWLVALCLLGATAVGLVGLTAARGVPDVVRAGLAWPLSGLRGLPWLGRSLTAVRGGEGDQRGAVVRTVVWSLLALVVFGLVLTSADALVRSWFSAVVPDLHLDGSLVARGFVAAFVAGLVLAAAYLGLNPPASRDLPERPALRRRYEWVAPALVVDTLLLVFLAAQATAAFGGNDYLRRTTGLTYADYVHQGFAQLTVATVLTLVTGWAVARRAPQKSAGDRAWLRGVLGAMNVLTMVVVASALYRLELYSQAYGFTRLRLVVAFFEGWLGLLVLGVLATGVTLRARWLPRAGVLAGGTLLVVLAAMNPDAWIAEHNLDGTNDPSVARDTDWNYLADLSADALPVLVDLPAPLRACALATSYAGDDALRPGLPRGEGWLGFNLGRSRARAALDGLRTSRAEAAVCGQKFYAGP